MALLQPIEIDGTGLFATYCRITHVSVDFTETREHEGQIIFGVAEVLVHAYADKAARDDGKASAALRRLIFTSADIPLENLSRAILYKAVQSTPDFKDAQDI